MANLSTESPVEPTEERPPRSSKPWRITATCLIVLTSILSVLAVDAVWIRDELLDTDQFVAALGPLIDDPQVQQQIVDKVNDDLLANVDLQGFIDKELPSGLTFLAGPAEEAIRSFVRTVTERIVESDQFATLYKDALRLTHGSLMKVLTGGGPRVQVENGVVTLDLTKLRTRVVDKINDSGLSRFINPDPDKVVRITLMESTSLAKAQRFIRLLDKLGIWLPLLTMVTAAAAIFASRSRRRGVLWVGAGVTIAMVVHLIALAVGRSFYVSAVTKTLSTDSSGLAFDLLVKFPRTGTRVVLLIALLMVVGALIAGPSHWAVRFRGLFLAAAGRGGAAAGAAVGPLASLGRAVAPHESGIRAAILVIAALSLAAGDKPTVASVIWTAIFTVVAILVLRIVAAAGLPQPDTPDTPDGLEAETPVDPEQLTGPPTV